MSAALAAKATEKFLAMADAEPGAVITVESSSLVDTYRFTKLENRDWQDDQGGKPWETQQLASILYSIGGQQTIHIPMKSHASHAKS